MANGSVPRAMLAELAELRKALEVHLPVLKEFTRHPNRTELSLHLFVAGQLRVLLCDSKLPLLVRYADARQIPLYVWATVSPDTKADPDVLFQFSGVIASWDPVPITNRLDLADYLDAEIGVIGQGSPYTPRQVIKWTANKEGIAHFDFHKPATLRNLKATKALRDDGEIDEYEVRRVIFQIGEWACRAIEHVLQAV